MYTCIICSKSLKYQSGLSRHKDVHESSFKAECTCGSVFSRPDSLKRHQLKCTVPPDDNNVDTESDIGVLIDKPVSVEEAPVKVDAVIQSEIPKSATSKPNLLKIMADPSDDNLCIDGDETSDNDSYIDGESHALKKAKKKSKKSDDSYNNDESLALKKVMKSDNISIKPFKQKHPSHIFAKLRRLRRETKQRKTTGNNVNPLIYQNRSDNTRIPQHINHSSNFQSRFSNASLPLYNTHSLNPAPFGLMRRF